jgi:Sporulation related domain.
MDDQQKPELSTERDALNLVRNRRLAKTPKRSFRLPMPAKISAVALIFIGAVTGVWLMRSSPHVVNEEDLPLLTAEFEGEEFKVEPDEADAFHVPHEDKTLYSEFEPKAQRPAPEKLRPEPEVPHSQVSQEELMAQAELASQSTVQAPLQEQADLAANSAQTPASVPTADNAASLSQDRDPTAEKAITVVESMESQVKEEATQAEQAPSNPQHKSVILALLANGSQQPGTPAEHPTPKTNGTSPAQASTAKVNDGAVPAPLKEAPIREMTHALSMAQDNTKIGMYWVQVASLPTETAAEKEWNRIQAKCTKDLNGHDHRLMRVDLGKPKGVRYRVQCGPFARPDAVQKCRNMQHNGVNCLVVKQ